VRCNLGPGPADPPAGLQKLDQTTERWLQRAQDFGHQHRRGIAAAVITLLGGFAITAFGIAPLAPDAAQLPQRVITEPVQPDDLGRQTQALADQPLALQRNDITRGTDTAESLLSRLGVADPSAAAFLRRDATARKLLAGRGGKMVEAQADSDGSLIKLVARYPAEDSKLAKTHFKRMTIARDGAGWSAKVEVAPLVPEVRLGSGTIRSTLFASTDESGLPDPVASQLAEIFSTDIDFRRELRKGDTFSVVYEAPTADGQVIAWNDGAGRVLAAEFVNGGHAYDAVWFADGIGRGAYFAPDGTSKQRAFLASPLAFSRITSGFKMRFDPILKKWRKHEGIDYGAPIGTPVRSVADGTVSFAGKENGYGNVVKVAHGRGRVTLYAHLSRIDVHRGEHVTEGEHVGAVGMTGWATGPHLHFEFIDHGVHLDPLKVAKSSESLALSPSARARFKAVAQDLQAKLQVADSMIGARSRVQ